MRKILSNCPVSCLLYTSVAAAGADVCEWIRLLKDRIPCVHLKDMQIKGWNQIMAPVMEGNLNFPAIFKELENSCCEYMLVEQDVCTQDVYKRQHKSRLFF